MGNVVPKVSPVNTSQMVYTHPGTASHSPSVPACSCAESPATRSYSHDHQNRPPHAPRRIA